MKKWLKRLGIALIVLLIVLVSLPVIFEKKIVRIVKAKLNEQVNASIDFQDYALGIFRTFPDFNLSLDSLTVDGIASFEGVRLAEIEQLRLELDIMTVLEGDQIDIIDFSLINPKFDLKVLETGEANWDIMKSEDETVEENTEEQSLTMTDLQSYNVENLNLHYSDAAGDMELIVRGLNHSGSGNFSADEFVLSTISKIDTLDYWMDGIHYINRASVEAKADLNVDLTGYVYTLKENEFRINELAINVDGSIAMPNEDIEMNLAFSSEKADFRSVLSMIPVVYLTDFQNIKTSGTVAISGKVEGVYSDITEQYPGLEIKIGIADGRFQYPSLPAAVEDVNLNLLVQSEGKRAYDDMIIDLKNGSLSIAGNPIFASLNLKTPISDPDIKATIKGSLQLEDISKVIPLQAGESYEGELKADVQLKGKLSAIEAKKYDQFDAKGSFLISDLKYNTPALKDKVVIHKMDMKISPQALSINTLESEFGKNDFNASGYIDNYLNYFFKGEPLHGNFDVVSNYLNLNDLMTNVDSENSAQTSPEKDDITVIDIPENLNINLGAKVNQLIYDDITIQNVTGNLNLKEKKVSLNGISMNLMGGTLGLDGAYDVSNIAKPTIDFQLNIKNWDIKSAADKFLTISTFAPIAKFCSGLFSTKINFKSDLDRNMSPVFSSVFAAGNLLTDNLDIKGYEGLIKLASELKWTKLASQKLSDLAMYFKIEDGRMNINPYTLKLGNSNATIAGYTGLSQEIFFKINFVIPRSEFGPDANAWINKLSDQASRLGIQADPLKTVHLDITADGTLLSPKFSVKWSDKNEDILKSLQDQVEQKVKEKVEEVKAVVQEKVDSAKIQLQEKVEETKQKLQEEWNKKADQLLAAAETQSMKIKQEATNLAQKIQTEAEARAKKLEDDAEGFLQKQAAKLAADKLRKESVEQADKLVLEANRRSDKLMAEARLQAENIRQGKEEQPIN